MKNTRKDKKHNMFQSKLLLHFLDVFFIFISFAIAFVLLLQSPLNPWSHHLADTDSGVFIYIGELLHRNGIPYRDACDQKGPMLFTIEYLGLALGRFLRPNAILTAEVPAGINRDTFGIWLLEVICLAFDVYFLYRCCRLVCRSRILSFVSSAVSFVPLFYSLYGGNFTEEWSLPFSIIGLYCFVDYLTKRKISFIKIITAGLCFGTNLMIRANMCAVFVAYAFWIFFILMFRKEWKKLWVCLLSFVSGTVIVIVPFVLFYAYHGALDDLWYWYIFYNNIYMSATGGALNFSNLAWNFIVDAGWLYFIAFPLLLLCLLVWERKTWKWVMFIHFFFALLLASVSGRMFSHYEIGINICAALPLAVCMDRFCYLLERLAEKSRCVGFKLRMIEELIGIVFGLLILTAIRHDGTIATLKDQFAFLSTHDQNDETLLQYIMDHTVETDPIMVGGMNCKYYIATGRYCNNRRFVQDYDLPTDDTMMREIQEDIDTNPPKLIIFRRKNVDGNPLSGWMLAFEKSMERRVMAGTFREDEDDFFIAFERN